MSEKSPRESVIKPEVAQCAAQRKSASEGLESPGSEKFKSGDED